MCGCDGNNYESECLARLAGVNTYDKGACPGRPCADSLNCARDQYCRKDAGPAACGVETSGVCEKRPFQCIIGANRQSCGCNGVSYEDSCLAAIDRVSVYGPGNCSTAIPAICARPVNGSKACTAKCEAQGLIVDDYTPYDEITGCPNQCTCKVQPDCPRKFKNAKACRHFCRKQRKLGVFQKVDPETQCRGVCTCVTST